MTYFNSRELAAVALFSSLWGVLNGVFSPIVFRMFGLPILCDMIGFAALGLTFLVGSKIRRRHSGRRCGDNNKFPVESGGNVLSRIHGSKLLF